VKIPIEGLQILVTKGPIKNIRPSVMFFDTEEKLGLLTWELTHETPHIPVLNQLLEPVYCK
jgi:hypothetical protein